MVWDDTAGAQVKLDKRRHFEGLLKSCQSWGASDTAALDKELPRKLGFVESLMSFEMAGNFPMNWSIAGNSIGIYGKICGNPPYMAEGEWIPF